MALFTPGGHLTGILDCDSFRVLCPSPYCLDHGRPKFSFDQHHKNFERQSPRTRDTNRSRPLVGWGELKTSDVVPTSKVVQICRQCKLKFVLRNF